MAQKIKFKNPIPEGSEYIFAETIEKAADGSKFNYIGRNKDNEIVFKILGSNLDITVEEA